MRIEPFGVEEWMNAWETKCTHNLAETCVSSLTVKELLDLVGANGALEDLLDLRLTYGEIVGSERLRRSIAGLYAHVSVDEVLVTHGAIGANDLVHRALVGPGDWVVSIVPTYQQHVSIPRSLGAEVVEVPLLAENGYLVDLDALAKALDGGATLLTMTNPNNPTGALMDEAYLKRVLDLARGAGAWVLCDEVYRGTEQVGEAVTPSIADLYPKGISTGSVSKAFSLAGLRLGWIAAPEEVLEQAMVHRDYTTISVGRIDETLATLALENAGKVLSRSRRICRANLGTLDAWVARERHVAYVKPRAGTTALVRYDMDIGSEAFCMALQKETGVMVLPGAVLGREGHFRVGFAFEEDVLGDGLERISGFLRQFD